ncbi:Hsp20 family protein [Gluconobacter frateurii]|uniref:Heat shock protein Hsp20 n=1 Tax=Gluconobacter frateurii NRIC 0228 TaxID=1307946 RepID=A0ABQ0QE03_9PROT|nr:Hsp20 family protein [Gluconobacter frateurii]GBR15246.1 heat shock protein Hsp20 [Gluconobacter frateurii NRIC 0228]GLP90258.1 heat-shock protein IbpA [Gluconobacter frateurii]
MSYDFTPLFRSAIGFDRLARVAGNAANAQAMPSYPPYNIEKTAETDYALTMALAGFGPEDVEVLQEDNTLVIRGRVPEGNREREWLHRGIATRAFERRFALADHTEIDQAELRNGLLTIVVRQVVPEAARPRRIPIVTGPAGAVMTPAAMGAESSRCQVGAPHAA